MGERVRTVCHVEREAYAAAVLVARMAEATLDPAPIWDDLKTFSGEPWRGVVDIVTAGYPCQPFSLAGKGLAERDPRHLWPHVRRVIGECEPSLVFLENVPGHVKRGFATVVRELQVMGFRVAAGLFSAEEVGAPHRRQRLFALAYSGGRAARQPGGGCWSGGSDSPLPRVDRPRLGESIAVADAHSDGLSRFRSGGLLDREWSARGNDVNGCSGAAMADAEGDGRLEGERRRSELPGRAIARHSSREAVANAHHARLEGWRESERRSADERIARPFGAAFPPPQYVPLWRDVPADSQPAVCRMADGLASRVERLQLCGNGVVPVVAAHAFLTLAGDLGVTL